MKSKCILYHYDSHECLRTCSFDVLLPLPTQPADFVYLRCISSWNTGCLHAPTNARVCHLPRCILIGSDGIWRMALPIQLSSPAAITDSSPSNSTTRADDRRTDRAPYLNKQHVYPQDYYVYIVHSFASARRGTTSRRQQYCWAKSQTSQL